MLGTSYLTLDKKVNLKFFLQARCPHSASVRTVRVLPAPTTSSTVRMTAAVSHIALSLQIGDGCSPLSSPSRRRSGLVAVLRCCRSKVSEARSWRAWVLVWRQSEKQGCRRWLTRAARIEEVRSGLTPGLHSGAPSPGVGLPLYAYSRRRNRAFVDVEDGEDLGSLVGRCDTASPAHASTELVPPSMLTKISPLRLIKACLPPTFAPSHKLLPTSSPHAAPSPNSTSQHFFAQGRGRRGFRRIRVRCPIYILRLRMSSELPAGWPR